MFGKNRTEKSDSKSEKNTNDDDSKPDDFMSIIVEKIYNFDWILLLCVAIAFIFVVSDIFYENVLCKKTGSVDINGDITNYGYMLQLITLLITTVASRFVIAIL